MGSNTEKKVRNNVQILFKYEAKKLRATTFAIAKLERLKLFREQKRKITILLSQYGKRHKKIF